MANIDKMQINIEVDSSQVKTATDDVNKLKNTSNDTIPVLNSFSSSLSNIAKITSAAAVIYEVVQASKMLVSEGVKFNAQIESMKIGIASLIAVSQENILASGQAISAQEKYRLAQIQTSEAIQMLKKANLETSATLEQLTEGFQSTLAPALQAGLSIGQTVEYTKLMTQAAGAMGMQMNMLPQEMRSIISGTIDMNSTVAKNIGITNEQIKTHKQQGDLFEFLKSKLEDFAVAGNEVSNSFSGSVSNMSDAFSNLAGIISKPIFEALKIEAQKTAIFLNDLSDSVQKVYDRMKSVHDLNTTEQLTTRAIEAYNKVIKKQEELNNASDFFGQKGRLSAELRAAKVELGAVNQQFEYIMEMKKKSESVKTKPEVKTIDKKTIKEAEQYADFMRKLNNDTATLALDAATKEYESIDIAEKDALKKYGINYTRKIEITQAFEEKRQALNDKYQALTEKEMAEFDVNETKKYNNLKATIESSLNSINFKGLTKLYNDIGLEEKKNLEDFMGSEEQKLSIKELYAKKINALAIEENNLKQSLETETNKKIIELIQDKYEKSKALAKLNNESNKASYAKQAQEDPMLASYYNQLSEIEDKLLEMSLNEININFTIDGLDETMESIKVASGEFGDFYNKSLDLQKEYAKEFLKANGDIEKEEKAKAKFDKANNQLMLNQKEAEINAYSNLAGAIGGALQEGSDAQKAFMVISKSLSLYNAVGAVIQAWNSAPFPANLPAVATTTAAVIPLLTSIGATLSGGQGTSSEIPALTQKEVIEAQYNPMIDRLDTQIEILKAIEKNGSAQAVSVVSAKLTYEKDIKILIADLMTGGVRDQIQPYIMFKHVRNPQDLIDTVDAINNAFGDTVWYLTNSMAKLDEELVKSPENFIKYLSVLKSLGLESLMIWGDMRDSWEQTLALANKNIGEVQNVIGEYASSMVDSVGELSDAKKDFEQIFDDITGTTKYQTLKLKEAFDNVSKLSTLDNLPTYLENQISAIQSIESIMNKDVLSLLLSKDVADFKDQVDALSLLNEKLGTTYALGSEEAINFIESLKLVASTMSASRENIKTFIDSLKTEQQLAYDKAIEQGVSLASTIEGLSDIFNKLSTDADGLTSLDLDLLNANLALIERTKENIKTFTDSLKTNEQLAYDKAVSQGVTLANTLEELSDIFNKLSTDVDGLTNADLDLLNANLALIETTKKEALQTEIDALNKTLTDTTTSIDTLQSALSSIDDIISTLRGSLGGTTYQLSDFYAELENLISLNGTSDYKAFAEALSKVSGKVSVLTNTESFQSKYDMAFQQARVAAQMEELNVGTLDQLDYLKLIEENTREQVSLLELQLTKIGLDLKSALLTATTNNELIDTTNNKITDTTSANSELLTAITNNKTTDTANNTTIDATSQLVIDTYQKILNRNPEDSGLAFWRELILSGTSPVNKNNIGVSIGATAVANNEISRSSYVRSLYVQGFGREPNEQELDYWANQSLTPTAELAPMFAHIDPNFKYFAEGGIVTKPTLGLIGEAGYSEAVIPLKQNNDLFQSQEIVGKLDSIKMLMIKLVADNSKMLTIDRAMYSNSATA